MPGELEMLRPDWPAPPRVRAAVTLRAGGVSRPPFDSLNLAAHVGDDPEAVAENRARVRRALELPREPVWLTQVHGIEVVTLARSTQATGSAATNASDAPTADAAITREVGEVCAIGIADCLPVLFAARDGSVVGAAHAGWRGLAGGVLEATVRALKSEPRQLLAWLGPAIGPEQFEVGAEVRAAFLERDPRAEHAFVPNSRGRWQCDLYALARARLDALGVNATYGGGWCTFADPQRFFSFRRTGRCGRMTALIWLEAAS
jgi:YfiH family protein